MLTAKQVVDNLPENVYTKSTYSRIYCILDALLSNANVLEMRTILTYMNMFLKSCKYDALDYIFGNIYGLPRLTEEKYVYRPLSDKLSPEQLMEVVAKDTKYRNRLMKFVQAAVTEGIEGIRLAVEAATGCPSEIYDQRLFGMGVNDPLNDPNGYYEFLIVPLKTDWSEADSFRTKTIVDRIKPSHLTYRIVPQVSRLKETEISGIEASSTFFQVDIERNIFEITKEFTTQNKVNGIAGTSSELIQEERHSTPGTTKKGPNCVNAVKGSGSPYIKRNVKYHSSSTVCWYGNSSNVDTGPNIYGHYGTDAFGDKDNDINSYWLSVGNGSPTDGYAFEWLELEITDSGEGNGFNEVWVKLPYPNMSMWISVMGTDGKWWDLGGGKIPYDPTHTAAYPNGADIPYVFYVPNTGAADTNETWHVYNLGRWFPNTKYVRVTFHNLYYSGIGTYKYRAAVSGFRVYANIVEYYRPERVINYSGPESNVPWISQAVKSSNSEDVWLKLTLNKKQEINRIKIKRGERSSSQIVTIKDDKGETIKSDVLLKSEYTTIPFNKKSISFFTIHPQKMDKLSILSNDYGLEISKVEAWLEEYIEGESYSTFKKPYPAKNVCDGNNDTFWHTAYRRGPQETMEYVVLTLRLTLPENNPIYSQINRIGIWAMDKGLEYKVKYYEPYFEEGEYRYRWRYAPISSRYDTKDYITTLNLSTAVSAAGLQIEIHKLAKQKNGMYAARIKEIKAWAVIETKEESEEIIEHEFHYWEPENVIDGNENTIWRSGGSISPRAVEYLNFSTPSSGEAIYGFYIDPETIGVSCGIYYTNDEDHPYKDKFWEPIYTDYWLERGMMWLPYPVNAKYWKFEFSNLKPNIYSYRIYGSEKKTNEKWKLNDSEKARIQGQPYPKFLERSSHTYLTYEEEAHYSQQYYVGIREFRAYKFEQLGRNPKEFEDTFDDDSFVDEFYHDTTWDPENNCIKCNFSDFVSGGFVSLEHNLASDLKSIKFEVDEHIPDGVMANWFISRNGGLTWWPLEYIKNGVNGWFAFPEDDPKTPEGYWDKLMIKLEAISEEPMEKIYVCNRYKVWLNYFTEF